MDLGGRVPGERVEEGSVSGGGSQERGPERADKVGLRAKGRAWKDSPAACDAGQDKDTTLEAEFTADLRLRPREGVDRLLTRVEFLPEHERALIEAVYRNGTPVVRLARLSVPTSKPRRLRRSVRLIVERMLSDRFVSMARCVSRGAVGRWPRTRRRVGELLYLQGKTLRQAAVELGLSVHVVRNHRGAIEAIFESEAR